jgi:hypothetical protein
MKLESNRIKNLFFQNLGYLRRVSLGLNKKTEVINNPKLKAAASRVNVPFAFEPYRIAIEKSLKRPFPRNLGFTVEEVRKEDELIIEQFSKLFLNLGSINIDYLLKASQRVSDEMSLSQGSVSPMSSDGSALRFPNSTSAGFPFFKRKDNEAARADAIEFAERHFHDPNFHKIMNQPSAVFHRYQYKVFKTNGSYSIKKKIRPVWGLPYRISVLEGMVFRNLLDQYELDVSGSENPISSVGRTKKQVSDDIIRRLRRFDRPIISVDYSKFDSTVPSFLWALFYAHIEANSNGIPKELLECLMSYHCFTPFCWNSTRVRYQQRGVPSGSLITSYFDTWVNRLIYHYSCYESTNGRYCNGVTAYTLGDDLIFVEVYTSLAHLISVSKRFHMVIDRESCSISTKDDEIDFLGYFWDIQNRPTQKLEWYVAHLVLPSRFIKVTDIPLDVLQTYRGISICMSLYQGMKMFERLVGYRDRVWIDLRTRYANGQDPIIQYVGEDQRMSQLRIPLSVIFNEGWESL